MKAGISLRVWVFACGVILLLFGLVSLAASNASNYREGEPVIVEYIGRDKTPGWEVSANFTKGDYIVADYRLHWTWKDPPYELIGVAPEEVSIKLISLDIFSPEGNHTMFVHVLAIETKGETPNHASLAKTVVDSGGGVIVNNVSNVAGVPAHFINETIGGQPVEELGGIAPCDGTYRLVIHEPYPPAIPSDPSAAAAGAEPPTWLALCRKTLERPLAFLLPVGAPVTVLGVVLVVWGKKSKQV